MPELPEVETVVTTLRPRVSGQKIVAVTIHRTDIVSPKEIDLAHLLRGRTIVSVNRRAKRIVLTLDDCNRFYIHLGMTGQLIVESADAVLKPHTHFVLDLEGDARQIRFRDPRRFGGIFWLGTASADGDLGPEPLTLKPALLIKILQKTTRPIKAALLDQTLIAGLGNIYADECLFLSGIHPLTRANRLNRDQVRRLNRAIKQTLRRAISAKGSTLRDFVTADNAPGEYRSKHKVYDRAGEECVSCGTLIRRIVLTGRSTCFCPSCQKRR